MNAVVAAALTVWGMRDADPRLIAERENAVYRVAQAGRFHALRLHRRGYRSDSELRSELQWMAALNAAGIGVPAPLPTPHGTLIEVIGGIQVDMLSWLGGTPLAQTDAAHAPLFRLLGQELARLHRASDDWTVPDGFTRPRWDAEGLIGPVPVWGPFWENPTLCPSQRGLLMRLRDHGAAVLGRSAPDRGLIHADPVGENVLVDGETLHLIDFDDGGYGYRLFDLATALVKRIGDPAYPELRAALISGYLSRREIDLSLLDLFMALRAATYVGWIVPRMDEPGAPARNERMIAAACRLADAVLGG